eukprot:15332720-Ditylum_brightwellii.AAC.1
MSTFSEDKARKKKRNNNHPQGRTIAFAQMLHVLLKYPEVITDLQFVSVQTLLLELQPRVDRFKKRTADDGAYIGSISDVIYRRLCLEPWRLHTYSEIMILHDVKDSNISVKKYYRWFHVQEEVISDDIMMKELSCNINFSWWIDGLQRKIKFREKDLDEIIDWVENLNVDKALSIDKVDAIWDMEAMFERIYTVCNI